MLNPRRLPRNMDALLLTIGLAVVAVSALVAWQRHASAESRDTYSGPIRNASDVPAEIQAVLQQADAPTHDEPTPWGLFVINPVINGEGVLNPQSSPLPSVDGPSAIKFLGSEQLTLDAAYQSRRIVPELPEELLKGMTLTYVDARTDGDEFARFLYFSSNIGTPDARTLEIQAFTPTGPVVFDEHPDNAIRDFSLSTAVRGHRTITVFPDPVTSDPINERTVAWSQGGAVYLVITYGEFSNDDTLAIANAVSAAEEASR